MYFLQNGLNPLLLIRPASISTPLSNRCVKGFRSTPGGVTIQPISYCPTAQCTWHFHFILLLVPTLFCMMRHTKGLLRYLYRSNYRLQLTVFSTCTFPSNTVGDCKYSSGIAHCRFDAQEQVQGVQGDPSTPQKEQRRGGWGQLCILNKNLNFNSSACE